MRLEVTRHGWIVGFALACSASGSAVSDAPFDPDDEQPSGVGGSAGDGGGAEGGGGPDDGGGGSAVQQPDRPDMDAAAVCGSSDVGFPGLRRLSRRELERSLRDVFPVLGADWASTLSADAISHSGFDNDASVLLVSKQTARELAATAESVGEAVAGSLAEVLPCADATADAACAGEFLDLYGRRLFRRPLTGPERESYLQFWQTAQQATGSFPESIGWLSRGLVESPHFVYRREIGSPDGDVVRLNQFEIATELAYAFSGTAPSDALLDRAERGELSSPDVLEATAKELLLEAGRGVIQNFFEAYVGHARVTTIAKAGVAEFADLRDDMLEETRRFIDEVVFAREGGSRELLTADFTTPSVALAGFYGYQGESAPQADYGVVPRPAERGIGLLAQGSVLSTLAQPDGSSPTKRGQWIFSHLLCNEIPPVPAAIPELGEPEPGVRTTRQRYEEDHAQGSCQGCHSMWDPIGFGFEHFYEAGRYRETEGGLEIDAASHVPHQAQTLFEFDGQEDLMTQLVEQPVVQECMTAFLATFAFGEELTCAGETRRAEFMNGGIGFVDYLASLAAEPHFSERRLE